jgi:hypothetical protein
MRRFVFVVGCLALVGCHEPRVRSVPPPPDGAELAIHHQVAGIHSREDRPLRLVIRDVETLARIPLVDVPVDFSREMLLVITLGRRISDQYSARINRVWRDGSALRVDYQTFVPPPDAPMVLCNPFCVAVVQRCDLPVKGFSPTVPLRRRGRAP